MQHMCSKEKERYIYFQKVNQKCIIWIPFFALFIIDVDFFLVKYLFTFSQISWHKLTTKVTRLKEYFDSVWG